MQLPLHLRDSELTNKELHVYMGDNAYLHCTYMYMYIYKYICIFDKMSTKK